MQIVLVAESCMTLCNPMDHSQPGSSVHAVLQTRKLGGLPYPSPEDLPEPGIEPRSPALQADSLPFELPRKPLDGYRILYLQDKVFLRLVTQQCKCT